MILMRVMANTGCGCGGYGEAGGDVAMVAVMVMVEVMWNDYDNGYCDDGLLFVLFW